MTTFFPAFTAVRKVLAALYRLDKLANPRATNTGTPKELALLATMLAMESFSTQTSTKHDWVLHRFRR